MIDSKTMMENSAAIYTFLLILHRMRSRLGLDAMLEYAGHYVQTIEKYNPHFKVAVEKALSQMSVEKIYKDALNVKKGVEN